MAVKVTTESGFTADIEFEEVRDDYEFLELLSEYDKGRLDLLPKLISIILGDDQEKKLREHCRNEKGRVSTMKMATEFNHIVLSLQNESKEAKN